MSNALDLDKLDELHAKATKEPWIESGRGIDGGEYQGDTVIGLEERGGPWQEYQVLDVSDDNRALIVALRNAYPALRAELRRLCAIEAAASAFVRRSRDSWTQHDELFEALVGVLERSGS